MLGNAVLPLLKGIKAHGMQWLKDFAFSLPNQSFICYNNDNDDDGDDNNNL